MSAKRPWRYAIDYTQYIKLLVFVGYLYIMISMLCCCLWGRMQNVRSKSLLL